MTRGKSDVASQVQQDHHEINQQIGELQVAMAAPIPSDSFLEWKLKLVWQLRDFKNRLLKHFDLEEEGGFMRDVLEVAPHSAVKIEQLKDEHERIVVQLDNLTSNFKRMKKTEADSLENARASLNEVISELRQHENEEHMLMQRAYFREFGGAD